MAGERDEPISGDVGRPDVATMRLVADLLRTHEPLAVDVRLDDPLSPREVIAEFEDGIGDADDSRLEVTWFSTGAYRYHYVDDAGVNWRFDRHPNDHSPERHFHAPSDADSESAVESCIRVTDHQLVTRAVLLLWRRAYETGSFAALNDAENPP